MELNQLDYFRTVARLENMTRAAEELFVSQPNLSTSISRLESSLGVSLFHRARGRIYLTETGRKFLGHVNAAFQELDDAMSELREGREYREDSIAVGASFAGLLPGLFSRYCRDYGLLPTTQLTLSTSQMVRLLEAGELDLGITAAPPQGSGLIWVPVAASPLAAVMREGGRWSGQCSGRLAELREAHFICNALYLERELLTSRCRSVGFAPGIVRTSNEDEVFDEGSVDFGDNVTLCPLHLLPRLTRTERFGLRLIPLGDCAPVEIGLLYPAGAGRTPFAAEFRACIRDDLAQMIGEQNQAGRDMLSRVR